MSIHVLLDMASSAVGDRVALGRRASGTTFAELARDAAGGAALLRESGAGSVAFLGENSPLLPTLLFATAAAGMPLVPLNYRLSGSALAGLLDRLDAPVVVASRTFAEIAASTGRPVIEAEQWRSAARTTKPVALRVGLNHATSVGCI